MKKNPLLKKQVRDLRLRSDMNVRALVNEMGASGGFTARNVATGVDVLERMLADDDCTRILSFPACIVATGLRGALSGIVKNFHALITTCGTLDHDLARAWGGKYFHGSFCADDARLHSLGINRLGNVFIPNKSYGITLEKKMYPLLSALAKQKVEWGGRELINEFGRRVRDENSIVHQAQKHNIPIFIPGITDGAFGTNLVLFSQDHKFSLNLLKDERELSDLIFARKRLGALMIGGGISKHHAIWWSQFKGGLDYAVYITTASQYDGSLSGARLEEAVSWGKVKERARYVTIDGDATVILPLLIAGMHAGRR
ncbi:MAG: deoxyhypusine synthase [Candidatus Micrarchaeota archaeon]